MRALAVVVVVVVVAITACGRIDFAVVPPDAPLGACQAATFGTPVLVHELTSTTNDGTARFSPDELTAYFWSDRDAGAQSDLFTATRVSVTAPFVVDALADLNTGFGERDPTISEDGTTFVFRQQDNGNHLHVASVTGGVFSDLGVIPTLDSGNDAQGYLVGNELYYDANGDLFHSVRTGTTFSLRIEISELSTTYDEGDPVVTEDGLTIFFRSNRDGGYDIYTATRATTLDVFGPATLVPNVSVADAADGPSWISPDGCRLYISSTRYGGVNHIYMSSK